MYLSFEGLLMIFYLENLHVVFYIKDISKEFVKNLKEEIVEISSPIDDYFQAICLYNFFQRISVSTDILTNSSMSCIIHFEGILAIGDR